MKRHLLLGVMLSFVATYSPVWPQNLASAQQVQSIRQSDGQRYVDTGAAPLKAVIERIRLDYEKLNERWRRLKEEKKRLDSENSRIDLMRAMQGSPNGVIRPTPEGRAQLNRAIDAYNSDASRYNSALRTLNQDFNRLERRVDEIRCRLQ